jgi:hypothetical protein
MKASCLLFMSYLILDHLLMLQHFYKLATMSSCQNYTGEPTEFHRLAVQRFIHSENQGGFDAGPGTGPKPDVAVDVRGKRDAPTVDGQGRTRGETLTWQEAGLQLALLVRAEAFGEPY